MQAQVLLTCTGICALTCGHALPEGFRDLLLFLILAGCVPSCAASVFVPLQVAARAWELSYCRSTVLHCTVLCSLYVLRSTYSTGSLWLQANRFLSALGSWGLFAPTSLQLEVV